MGTASLKFKFKFLATQTGRSDNTNLGQDLLFRTLDVYRIFQHLFSSRWLCWINQHIITYEINFTQLQAVLNIAINSLRVKNWGTASLQQE